MLDTPAQAFPERSFYRWEKVRVAGREEIGPKGTGLARERNGEALPLHFLPGFENMRYHYNGFAWQRYLPVNSLTLYCGQHSSPRPTTIMVSIQLAYAS